MNGELVSYNGDPLQDFGIGNFLDRIAYKNPKSADKLAKFKTKMSNTEKPINEYDFARGDKPLQEREEEKYLYKYFSAKPPKDIENKKLGAVDLESGSEDEELEAFAHNVM